MASEQAMAKRAVGGQEEAMTETDTRTNMRQQQCQVLHRLQSLKTEISNKLPKVEEGKSANTHHPSLAARKLEGLLRSRPPQQA